MGEEELSEATRIAQLEKELYHLKGSMDFYNNLRKELEKDIRNIGVAMKEAAEAAPLVGLWDYIREMNEQVEWLGNQAGDRVSDIVDLEKKVEAIQHALKGQALAVKGMTQGERQVIYERGFEAGQRAAYFDNFKVGQTDWVRRPPDEPYVKEEEVVPEGTGKTVDVVFDSGSKIGSKAEPEDPKRGSEPVQLRVLSKDADLPESKGFAHSIRNPGIVHFFYEEKGTYICGPNYTKEKATYNPKDVTCKNCLTLLRKRDGDTGQDELPERIGQPSSHGA